MLQRHEITDQAFDCCTVIDKDSMPIYCKDFCIVPSGDKLLVYSHTDICQIEEPIIEYGTGRYGNVVNDFLGVNLCDMPLAHIGSNKKIKYLEGIL